jgi:acetolactate synthase-1/2/3 large subunit
LHQRQAKNVEKQRLWEEQKMSKADAMALPHAAMERPVASPVDHRLFGSDLVAETLRALDIPFIALNPGASFRGLHDSLVNHLGNVQPQVLLCLHEEHAIAIAHGWAKVTGTPMAAAVHSNVGLMHGAMAIFNAWCDRMPVIVIGATGPVDAVKRRPWIDWIHTARDQGALVRHYVKWDDQPASPVAAREALLRAAWIATTAPHGPVYLNLDAELQEAALDASAPPIDADRYRPPPASAAPAAIVAEVASLLVNSERPVILAGRATRSPEAWDRRVALAERLGARVLTDLKIGASFPTDHPLHAGAPGIHPAQEAVKILRRADVILSLDWVDLGGTLHAITPRDAPDATIIQVSLDHTVHNGWSMDHQTLPPVDLYVAAEPDAVVSALLDAIERRPLLAGPDGAVPDEDPPIPDEGPIDVELLGRALCFAVGTRPVSLTHLPLSWSGASWHFRHPLDFLGSDGGGGIGGGPGISVGAALALRGSGRLPVAVCGDGDFLMGVTALWTAAHYRIPLLVVVANNRSFFNDEAHQERIARMRGRPVENRWIGQRRP